MAPSTHPCGITHNVPETALFVNPAILVGFWPDEGRVLLFRAVQGAEDLEVVDAGGGAHVLGEAGVGDHQHGDIPGLFALQGEAVRAILEVLVIPSVHEDAVVLGQGLGQLGRRVAGAQDLELVDPLVPGFKAEIYLMETVLCAQIDADPRRIGDLVV